MKAVDLSYGVTASGVFGVQEGQENISKIKKYRKKLQCNALQYGTQNHQHNSLNYVR